MPAVVILGCGGVGRALLKQIAATKLTVAAVCDSKNALVAANGAFTAAQLSAIAEAKAAGKPLAVEGATVVPVTDSAGLAAVLKQCKEAAGGKCFVADCTASDATGPAMAEAGVAVALANKKPVTSSIDLYNKLALENPRNFRNESTVGAGLPVMAMLRRMVTSGDPISRVAGCFSGTLGFVMSGLEAGKKLSDVVAEAKSLGYTEPDPREDLSGMDVARKALIIARSMGWKLEMDDVKVEGMYPPEMGQDKMSVDEFMAALPSLDADMAGKAQAAAADGKVLRFAAVVADGKCLVGLQSVPKNTAMGALQGTDNIVEVISSCYPVSPLVIQGAGAGTETTASGVLADLLELADIHA
jgi:homoserine dehydrogenase|uniref:Homoserine dehydrogenase n=1 Tax=Eutreptiella gymnastica TaxID=73025 RepID=A0A6T2J3W8_9EUGL